jgi:hypothetical protein
MVTHLVPVSADKTYRGEACVFMLRRINVSTKLIFHNTKEQDLEICAIQLETKTSYLLIMKPVQSSIR